MRARLVALSLVAGIGLATGARAEPGQPPPEPSSRVEVAGVLLLGMNTRCRGTSCARVDEARFSILRSRGAVSMQLVRLELRVAGGPWRPTRLRVVHWPHVATAGPHRVQLRGDTRSTVQARFEPIAVPADARVEYRVHLRAGGDDVYLRASRDPAVADSSEVLYDCW